MALALDGVESSQTCNNEVILAPSPFLSQANNVRVVFHTNTVRNQLDSFARNTHRIAQEIPDVSSDDGNSIGESSAESVKVLDPARFKPERSMFGVDDLGTHDSRCSVPRTSAARGGAYGRDACLGIGSDTLGFSRGGNRCCARG